MTVDAQHSSSLTPVEFNNHLEELDLKAPCRASISFPKLRRKLGCCEQVSSVLLQCLAEQASQKNVATGGHSGD